MRRFFAAAALSLGLAGCGAQLVPPGMPTIQAIQVQSAQTSAIPAASVHDFYTNGLLIVQENCGGYFDQAVLAALQNAQTVGQAQLLSGLALGIMGITGAGAGAAAGAGLGSSLVSNWILNQQSNSLAGTDPAGTYTATMAAQQMLINAINEPTTAADALADIYAVYRACSPAGIQAMKEQAIMNAPNHMSVVGAMSPPVPTALRSLRAPAEPLPRGRGIPIIRVQ